ncbi:MAG: hypothetical protein OER88_07010, partial [Planctomycetota bacterium]|nr:hypothetical protein [Planctomycetota bacterium]
MTKRPSAVNNDPGYFYNQKQLLKIFAILSTAMLVGIFMMIWADFDRPWKDDQREYMRWDARKLALERMILQTRVQSDQQKFGEMRVAAKAKLAEKDQEIRDLEEKIEGAKGARYGADMAYKEQKQYTLQANYHVHEAHSPAERDRWTKRLEKEQDKEYRLRDAFQASDAKLASLVTARKQLDKDLDDILIKERANADLKRLALVATGIEKKRGYNPLREIPLLD